MSKMAESVQLKLLEPMYGTYHDQLASTAIIADNPSIRNFSLNNTVELTCTRRFLSGFTTPEANVSNSMWPQNPYFEREWVATWYADGYANHIFKNMLRQGLYIYFWDVDDYYIEGKTWCGERHFDHNGLITGFDNADRTFTVFAYDSNWVLRTFRTPQSGFTRGRKAALSRGKRGGVCGLRPKTDTVGLLPQQILTELEKYLSSTLKTQPFDGEGMVRGAAVHLYLAEYVRRLYDGRIPYERMDRRVFRLLWEHKKAMLERVAAVEDALGLNHETSADYARVVAVADTLRLLYASHHMKRRDSVLPVIATKLELLDSLERELLGGFTEKMKGSGKL